MEKNLKIHYVISVFAWIFMISFDIITGFADHGVFEILWFIYFGYVNVLISKKYVV